MNERKIYCSLKSLINSDQEKKFRERTRVEIKLTVVYLYKYIQLKNGRNVIL